MINMKKINRIGNIPKLAKIFLTSKLPLESEKSEVYECSHDELIDKCKIESLEPQVIIDKSETGKSYLFAIGASIRSSFISVNQNLKPIIYFCELDESRKRQFIKDLNEARAKVRTNHSTQLEINKLARQEARKKALEYRKTLGS